MVTGSSDSEAEVCRRKDQRMDVVPSDAKRSAEQQSLSSPPPNNLSAANAEICASRQSFRLAMSNACTYPDGVDFPCLPFNTRMLMPY